MSDAFLFVHITGGSLSILAGFVALFARKGERLHRAAGNVFFIAMVIMCISAFAVATIRGQTVNSYAALLTLYLIGTSWTAAVRGDRVIGRFEYVALLAGVLIAGSAAVDATTASKSIAPLFGGVAALAGLSAAFDASVIARGGVAGAQRIARHLWRMTFAMFVATGSFFVGQPTFIPAEVKAIYLNTVPPLLVIAFLVYWLVRVLFTRWYSADADGSAAGSGTAFAKSDSR
jgi:uncharacterized membrane protein